MRGAASREVERPRRFGIPTRGAENMLLYDTTLRDGEQSADFRDTLKPLLLTLSMAYFIRYSRR